MLIHFMPFSTARLPHYAFRHLLINISRPAFRPLLAIAIDIFFDITLSLADY